jgi:hypothetical protein
VHLLFGLGDQRLGQAGLTAAMGVGAAVVVGAVVLPVVAALDRRVVADLP